MYDNQAGLILIVGTWQIKLHLLTRVPIGLGIGQIRTLSSDDNDINENIRKQ